MSDGTTMPLLPENADALREKDVEIERLAHRVANLERQACSFAATQADRQAAFTETIKKLTAETKRQIAAMEAAHNATAQQLGEVIAANRAANDLLAQSRAEVALLDAVAAAYREMVDSHEELCREWRNFDAELGVRPTCDCGWNAVEVAEAKLKKYRDA